MDAEKIGVIARAIFEALEAQGPENPYVGTFDDPERVVLDGDFDLLAVAEAVWEALEEDV